MKTKSAHLQEIRNLAAQLEQFNTSACIHFAELLRMNDEQKRICSELSQPVEDLIPRRYIEACYWILSLGPKADRLALMSSDANDIDRIIGKVLDARGFSDETGFWIEVL